MFICELYVVCVYVNIGKDSYGFLFIIGWNVDIFFGYWGVWGGLLYVLLVLLVRFGYWFIFGLLVKIVLRNDDW